MEKVGYFNEDLRYALDYEYWLRLLKFSSPHVISKALSCFRIHTASKGGQGYPSQFQEGYTVVATYEHRPLVLQLHKIHNAIITNMYHRIK